MSRPKPLVLTIMDGWGENPDPKNNAVAMARKPNFDRLRREYPNTLIRTDGPFVGLPEGQMGNSEVGHLNIGAGRIVKMDNWGSDFLDLVEEAHLTFDGAADGEIAFGALKGFLDVRYGAREGSACAEFSWEGYDENDSASGRGWAAIGTAGRLVGHFYIHNGDESGFVCERD